MRCTEEGEGTGLVQAPHEEHGAVGTQCRRVGTRRANVHDSKRIGVDVFQLGQRQACQERRYEASHAGSGVARQGLG